MVSVAGCHLKQARRHLDIGSSSGELLQTFSSAFGSEAYGVELGEYDRSEAEARGINTYPELENVPPKLTGTFDIITLSHVLEHLPDPAGNLRAIKETWLSPEGLLLVEVPDLYAHPAFEPGHLIAFTGDTLRRILAESGYEVLELRRHGQPYSRLLPLFLLAVAKATSSPVGAVGPTPSPLWIRFRRWSGMIRLGIVRFMGRVLLGRKRLQPWARGK